MLTSCSRTVFRCFKALERAGDRLTGAAGPFFVGLAVVLISTGAICFFDVIAPSLPYPLITLPLCLLIALNLFTHYFYVCTVRPGFVDEPPAEPGRSILWARRSRLAKGRALTGGVRWSRSRREHTIVGYVTAACSNTTTTVPVRPAPTLRIPFSLQAAHSEKLIPQSSSSPTGINQCVGLHNERHFVLFMAYLVLSTLSFSTLGYPHLFSALGLGLGTSVPYEEWPHRVPEIAFIITYLLSVVLCLAVGIMLAYHLYGVARAETNVEGQDFEVYRRKARERGETFVNSYDLGPRRNLQLFFNLGEAGYPIHTLLLPLRLAPYTDGRHWARREGFERHAGVRRGEELTDEEDE
ncbi:putative DHHC palmitoyltransferase family protein [Lyophyllum shimeji]|uniref:Palmitoyltransferase n=1 Tax=Lyophyllum shimeji TaxID=47721 RepID=A0A9P3PQG0_LYOSH|nr:putative DHHC palmitoyltransferase family protein [Lyophyllum shimeji]